MIQEPKYTLLQHDQMFELRNYQAYPLIEAKDTDIRGYQGFQLAFDFIQGDNDKRQKIAMTAPVVNSFSEHGVETTSFVMPPQMDYKDVPSPVRSDLKKIYIPERMIAVIKFTNTPKLDSITKYEQSLRDWIYKNNLETIGQLQLARYNPPFIPGFLKRNELWLEVKPK